MENCCSNLFLRGGGHEFSQLPFNSVSKGREQKKDLTKGCWDVYDLWSQLPWESNQKVRTNRNQILNKTPPTSCEHSGYHFLKTWSNKFTLWSLKPPSNRREALTLDVWGSKLSSLYKTSLIGIGHAAMLQNMLRQPTIPFWMCPTMINWKQRNCTFPQGPWW